MNVFSAGEDWIENPETYESSFYKRTLDNDIYIFTAPSFSSKCLFSLLLLKRLRYASIPEEAFPRSPFGSHRTVAGEDHALWPLISLFLSFSCSRCVFQQSSPSPPAYFLLSALISLADISAENKKKRAKPASLDWITTCAGSTDRSPLPYIAST